MTGCKRKPWTRRALTAAIGLGSLSLACTMLLALIDPRFTPMDLVNQSRTILVVRPKAAANRDEWTLEVTKVLKGKAGASAVLGLVGCDKTDAENVRRLLTQNAGAAVPIFASNQDERVYADVDGTWLTLKAGGDGRYDVQSLAPRLSGMFAGGSDMLIRMAHYLLADPQARVPVSVGVSWLGVRPELGKVGGEIAGMQPLKLGNDAQMSLFIGSPAGDRLFRAVKDDEAFQEITAKAGLKTRSHRFLWTDLDDDGKAELVTWDGATLAFWAVRADETLTPAAGFAAYDLPQCLGLAACRLWTDARPAILVSTETVPFLLCRDNTGDWVRRALPVDGIDATEPAMMPGVVADLDNDGFWDVLQPGPKQGRLWKGTAQGPAKPVASAVVSPEASRPFTLGDFNQDGYLDIFIGGLEENYLWENDGKGGFVNVTRASGSLSYRSVTGLSACATADLNQDGRPDLCLLHAERDFTYHFNRGFRCFGEEGELRLGGFAQAADAADGQKACAVADFNGDGSLDLAVAFVDGRICCYYNDNFNRPMIQVGLKRGVVGPVTVSLWPESKYAVAAGALPVTSEAPKACFCPGAARNCVLRWSQPGKPDLSLKVAIPDKLPAGGIEILVGE